MSKSYLLSLLLVSGLVTLSCSEAWARGRGGTHSVTRGAGSYQRSYQGYRTGARGNTSLVERSANYNRTGPNSYSKDGYHQVTGPRGQTRQVQAQGSGSVYKTENGYSKSYSGSLTGAQGKSLDVNRSSDVIKNEDGTRTKETTSTYTNQQGQSKTVER